MNSEVNGKPGAGKLVLIVDDELEIMHLLFAMLEESGFSVIGTKTAQSGLVVARTIRPHIILMDVRMPGMDGFEASRRLKDDEATAHILLKGGDVSRLTPDRGTGGRRRRAPCTPSPHLAGRSGGRDARRFDCTRPCSVLAPCPPLSVLRCNNLHRRGGSQ